MKDNHGYQKEGDRENRMRDINLTNSIIYDLEDLDSKDPEEILDYDWRNFTNRHTHERQVYDDFDWMELSFEAGRAAAIAIDQCEPDYYRSDGELAKYVYRSLLDQLLELEGLKEGEEKDPEEVVEEYEGEFGRAVKSVIG